MLYFPFVRMWVCKNQGWEVNASGEYLVNIFQVSPLSIIIRIIFAIIKIHFTELKAEIGAYNFIGQV